MKIIPVIDVMNGVVVHGIGGQRDTYQPIRSSIVNSAEPRHVAERMLNATASEEIYLADLDAIRGDGRPSPAVRKLIPEISATIWLDPGIRNGQEANELLHFDHVNLVVGTETCQGPAALNRVLTQWPAERVAVSIDLFSGKLFRLHPGWHIQEPFPDKMIDLVIACGIRTVIVLDLALVGNRCGLTHTDHASRAKHHTPKLRVIVGGGVSSRDIVQKLAQFQVDAVLVATAIHEGVEL